MTLRVFLLHCIGMHVSGHDVRSYTQLPIWNVTNKSTSCGAECVLFRSSNITTTVSRRTRFDKGESLMVSHDLLHELPI